MRCGCGGSCGCSLTGDGTSFVVTGSGTSGNPWVGTAHVNCTEARACFSAGNGLAYDSSTGTFSAKASPAAGNALTSSASGLYVPSSTVTVGCGLSGNGSAGTPLAVKTLAWPFTCTPTANGSVVACDDNGNLRGEPPYHTYFFQLRRTDSFAPGALPVPANLPMTDVGTPLSFDVTNPDPCRSMRVLWKQESRMYVNLPPNSAARTGQNTEEYWAGGNTGTGTIIASGVYTDKLNQQTGSLGPGATVTLVMQPQAGAGTGGASIVQIHMSHRVWLMPT